VIVLHIHRPGAIVAAIRGERIGTLVRMSTIQNILKDARTAMDKDIAHTKHEFSSVRSGKASPSMLDSVKSRCTASRWPQPVRDGQRTRAARADRHALRQRPDQGRVEKAIREAGLGLEPSAQGAIIRVPLPQMNEQRRKSS